MFRKPKQSIDIQNMLLYPVFRTSKRGGKKVKKVSLGNNIAKLRKERKITQQELAEALGIKRTSLSHIETGFYTPSAKTMKKISDYLQVPLGDIFFNPDVLKSETDNKTA